jgi:energy-coupling factor transporter ATP-binding protein EcfA2
MTTSLYRYSAFGLRLVSDEPLPGFRVAEPGVADLQVFFHAKVPNLTGQGSIRRDVPEVPGLVYETTSGADTTEIRVLHESGSIRSALTGTTIAFEWSRGIDIRTVKALFSGMLLKSIALWRQKFALHAGAIEISERKAFVVAGQKGAGKSTLLAGLYAAGAHLVAEDMTVLSRCDGGWQVHSGARILKLWPQTAATLALDAGGTPDAGEWHSNHPSTADFLLNQKVLLDTTARDGACGPEASPLVAIYLLGSRSPPGGAVALERLGKQQAVALLARELSAVPEMLEPREDKKAALQNVLALVQDVPIYRLRLPNDLARVQAVAAQLMQGTPVTVQ